MLRGGDPAVPARLRVISRNPNGRARTMFDQEIRFAGENGGHNLTANLTLFFDNSGKYWFDVYCDARLMTRVPYVVRFGTPGVGPEEAAAQALSE